MAELRESPFCEAALLFQWTSKSSEVGEKSHNLTEEHLELYRSYDRHIAVQERRCDLEPAEVDARRDGEH